MVGSNEAFFVPPLEFDGLHDDIIKLFVALQKLLKELQIQT